MNLKIPIIAILNEHVSTLSLIFALKECHALITAEEIRCVFDDI